MALVGVRAGAVCEQIPLSASLSGCFATIAVPGVGLAVDRGNAVGRVIRVSMRLPTAGLGRAVPHRVIGIAVLRAVVIAGAGEAVLRKLR